MERAVMDNINWYHVFDSTNRLWLKGKDKWSPDYRDAKEFSTYEEAHAFVRPFVARRDTIIILADCGAIES
jgi:hypothetical protein